MALVTLSGFPCAGKTTRARELETYLSERLSRPDCPPFLAKAKVLVINDESLSLAKTVYDGQFRVWSLHCCPLALIPIARIALAQMDEPRNLRELPCSPPCSDTSVQIASSSLTP